MTPLAPLSCGLLVARYARPRLEMKKTVARTAVVRDRKLAEPLAPNRLPEEPPPKPEPMSAPRPCCRSTRPMIASASSTCSTISTLVQSITSSLCARLPCSRGDRDEFLRYQRRAADQAAVD